ncbi:sigma-54-dependent transcriptional regulator [Schlesneria paludicola]|uniref:sigma-54-dependent transcriptional regulator n=1 Tax=Schlesneria paludicola TaxID=360056 RepID=UPI00029B0278|nr:sigma-54 dependent transcriptional regulator [Schlesneria paludicola]
MTNKPRILIVEDQPRERDALARLLRAEGYQPLTAKNCTEALAFVTDSVSLVISDLRLGQESGVNLLQAWKSRRPETPFVVVTAYGEVSSAVGAIKLGAEDYLQKPLNPEGLLLLIRRLVVREPEHSENRSGDSDSVPELAAIIGQSPPMKILSEQIQRVAVAEGLVLILGESGTGKELVAEAIHRLSRRANGPFVAVNMAAVPESLAEAELFGAVKGAFTGADSDRIGRFEAAHQGTLFIDEIGDFPLAAQVKLLRVLENLTISPVGTNEDRRVDVRVIAATSRNLQELIQQNQFREDLFYRLNVLTIELPPLRNRPGDVALLIDRFLQECRERHNRPGIELSGELREFLQNYEWPGNVRQLRNAIENMVVMGKQNPLSIEDLPAYLSGNPAAPKSELFVGESPLQSLERSAILSALDRFQGNRTRAAEALGISVRTLQRKLKAWQSNE